MVRARLKLQIRHPNHSATLPPVPTSLKNTLPIQWTHCKTNRALRYYFFLSSMILYFSGTTVWVTATALSLSAYVTAISEIWRIESTSCRSLFLTALRGIFSDSLEYGLGSFLSSCSCTNIYTQEPITEALSFSFGKMNCFRKIGHNVQIRVFL